MPDSKLIPADDRPAAEAIARLGVCNPFLAERVELRTCLLESVGRVVGDRDSHSLAQPALCDGAADSTRAARDERELSSKI